ncbi:hypothetical protein [Peribacillus sp. ACCC06369]|uniref:hypothetical protein n=1 Tax=Peribacillus sp. ACCC06369 TaxID=3055860 RepID=UPI0025A04168|nr:hypothetical protein [Peribacillus sp. ACCC06369]MDM5358906.1 hypothetical protein [Peribacillus sp. ACCC06369]
MGTRHSSVIDIGGIIYYFITMSQYNTTEDLYGFPVPRNAELVHINEQGKRYNWSRATEENGIPYRYELALKADGWKKGESEGASVFYKKGNNTIDLITTTSQLEILRVK